MKKYNAIRLLSLFVLGASVMFSMHSSYAALLTPTAINSITVNANDSVDLVCTDPTFDAGEIIEGREVLIDDDVAFGSPEVTVGGPLDTATITCDGATVNNISFSGNYNDFDVINVRLTVYDDNNNDSFADSSFIVADNTNPVVTGSTTNIIDGGSIAKTALDQYVESCTATDNDPAFIDNCAVQSGGIDTSVLGLQSVTYFATDPSGNVGTQTITTTVTLGNAPVITISGDNPANIEWGSSYVDAGATALDVEDGDLTGSIITTGLPINTFSSGAQLVTFSVTDSSGNLVTATRTVNVANEPVRGRSCGGDCYHPHFGVDQNGRSFYDDGLKINTVQYKIDNVLHNHPDKIIELPVGVPVTFVMKASDTTPKSIRHMELALGIQRGHFDKQSAAVIIDLDIDFQGNYVTSYEGDYSLVKDVKSHLDITDKNAIWHLSFVPTQHLQHDMFAISAFDEYQYVGTYYVNEGITFKGVSQNGVPEFSYLDNRGRMHTLTIVDKTLEDLSVAVDEQGNTWNLDHNLWMKEYKSPENLQMQIDRINREIEATKASQYFDSDILQKDTPKSYAHELTFYERGHDPVPNMSKAFAEYQLSRKDVVNHSSYSLD